MTSLSKRIERLEKIIKPAGAWWERLTFTERIEAWRQATERELYLDFNTGKEITLEELAAADPERWTRIVEVMNSKPLSGTYAPGELHKQARGLIPWQDGDPLPEETIRRLRDEE